MVNKYCTKSLILKGFRPDLVRPCFENWNRHPSLNFPSSLIMAWEFFIHVFFLLIAKNTNVAFQDSNLCTLDVSIWLIQI